MTGAYYNEIDPHAAQWLRNLIAAGHIAPGDVDERSIEDVQPDDLRGYSQCHFFAGIGVWSYALRRAGWADDRPVWTGSCPCQPFSAAGKGAGFDDERHLWPAWYWLIGECRPPVIFGEQVASSAVEPWIDLVHADMEALDYPFGCVPFPSAGVGAPHIRDRAYWMAYADHARSQGRRGMRERAAERSTRSGGVAGRLADAGRQRFEQHAQCDREPLARCEAGALRDDASGRGDVCGLADTSGSGRLGRQGIPARCFDDGSHARRIESHDGSVGCDEARISRVEPACPTNGVWRDADWLLCRDGKWRPVEPGTFPLVDGAPSRVGRLRAYGNAINAEAATAFIEASCAALGDYDLC
ncbi:DNA cytosine methyltransferase [Burkholderia sp. IDO3]|uniref:DNA cytosine methyltransferase n=1 Tax=Burkholderia sp. IDO3 TaxID=1705310 RepID=UPI000BBA9F87|nr:DNA cytosine methyltransferase [Burkholderia sp. IDO3]AXK65972.1 DNA cytosine methyltransferase [Burkholderia sp. IDO3]PCD57034.1 methyltransferase [Burkholderia sp. IDO3]